MRVAVLANLKQNAPAPSYHPSEPARLVNWAELDSVHTVEAITGVLSRAGYVAEYFEGDLGLVQALPRFAPDLCLNLCEGHFGDSRESHVPALLEMLRLPYTGSGVLALAVTLDKPTTKRLIIPHGVRTPPFQVFERPDAELDPALRFPLFTKPAAEGSSIGISGDNVVHNIDELRQRVAFLLMTYRQPVLVERFIRGREVTIGVFGNTRLPSPYVPSAAWAKIPQVGGLLLLPPYEILHDHMPTTERGAYTQKIKMGAESQWTKGLHYQCPAVLPDSLCAELYRFAALTFEATGCRDVARVDFRLDASDHDRPYVLEINALPGVAPGWSDLCHQATAAGLSYDDLILGIVAQATHRLGLSVEAYAGKWHEALMATS